MTTFIDNLGLTEVLIFFGAVILTYMGVTAWWWMRKNDAERVRSTLRGGAVPLGVVGFASLIMGFWSEFVWPYPWTPRMAAYNVIFGDVTFFFGLVMVAVAITTYFGLRMQYVGVFGFVAGIVTLLYGYTMYMNNFTKDPFGSGLLFAGFGVAGILSLPATVVVDYYFGTAATSPVAWRSPFTNPAPVGRSLGVRAAQPVAGSAPSRSGTATDSSASTPTPSTLLRYRMPFYTHLLVLAFPFFMALAGYAAWTFLASAIPGHIGSPTGPP